MKKSKRERLYQIKEEKRMEWERVKALQEEDREEGEKEMEEAIEEDAIFGTIYTHFFNDEYGCEKCSDYVCDLCEGKGYTTFDECYECMKEKCEKGEIAMMTNFRF